MGKITLNCILMMQPDLSMCKLGRILSIGQRHKAGGMVRILIAHKQLKNIREEMKCLG